MKLLGSQGSPFVRKARIFALEKGIDVEFVLDRPLEPGSKIPGLNPLGKMPVLVLDDGEGVYDSVVIVECLEGLKREPQLIPSYFRGRIAVRCWEALGDGIAEAVVNLSHEYGPMNDAQKRSAWTPRQEAKVASGLAHIERSIAGREWLHGDAFTLADIAAGNAIAYVDSRLPGFDRKKRFPGLAAYAEKLMVRASFRKTDPNAK